MSDTAKMPRPKFPRNDRGVSGRVEHDARGNAIWVRTRATDSTDVAVNPALAIVEDSKAKHESPAAKSILPKPARKPRWR